MTDPRDRTPAMTSPTTLTAAAEPVVTLEDASFAYGSSTVLTGVTGRVPAGQALALVGPNGSGKTTLMRALLGMVTVSRGRVRVNGAAPGRAPRGCVGYVPQLSDLGPTFPVTVREVVQMGMYSQLGILRRPGAEARRRALEALDSVGLADRADRRFGTLSGGQQQRVLVARCVAARTSPTGTPCCPSSLTSRTRASPWSSPPTTSFWPRRPASRRPSWPDGRSPSDRATTCSWPATSTRPTAATAPPGCWGSVLARARRSRHE